MLPEAAVPAEGRARSRLLPGRLVTPGKRAARRSLLRVSRTARRREPVSQLLLRHLEQKGLPGDKIRKCRTTSSVQQPLGGRHP